MSRGSFVLGDRQFLNDHFNCIEYDVQLPKQPLHFGWRLIKFAVYIFIHVPRVDLIYTWFTDYHSPILTLCAMLFRKSIYRVIGGYEVESIPEFKYGGLQNPIRKRAILFSLNRATQLLAVSEYTREKAITHISHNRIQVVYNGINTELFVKKNHMHERSYFLTVGYINNDQKLGIKGIHRFVRLAECLKHETFLIVGVSQLIRDQLQHTLPGNVRIESSVPTSQLLNFYHKARYYVQLSEVESFGVAILEALSCGAIPIISNRGALPECFGSCSLIIDIERFDHELKALPMRLKEFNLDPQRVKDVIAKFDIINRYRRLEEILPVVSKVL